MVVARIVKRSVRGAGYVNRVRPDLWGDGGVIRLSTRHRTQKGGRDNPVVLCQAWVAPAFSAR